MSINLLEVTQRNSIDGLECIQLGMSRVAFAHFMGYASLEELLTEHRNWELALQHWKRRWEDLGLKVVIDSPCVILVK